MTSALKQSRTNGILSFIDQRFMQASNSSVLRNNKGLFLIIMKVGMAELTSYLYSPVAYDCLQMLHCPYVLIFSAQALVYNRGTVSEIQCCLPHCLQAPPNSADSPHPTFHLASSGIQVFLEKTQILLFLCWAPGLYTVPRISPGLRCLCWYPAFLLPLNQS